MFACYEKVAHCESVIWLPYRVGNNERGHPIDTAHDLAEGESRGGPFILI